MLSKQEGENWWLTELKEEAIGLGLTEDKDGDVWVTKTKMMVNNLKRLVERPSNIESRLWVRDNSPILDGVLDMVTVAIRNKYDTETMYPLWCCYSFMLSKDAPNRHAGGVNTELINVNNRWLEKEIRDAVWESLMKMVDHNRFKYRQVVKGRYWYALPWVALSPLQFLYTQLTTMCWPNRTMVEQQTELQRVQSHKFSAPKPRIQNHPALAVMPEPRAPAETEERSRQMTWPTDLPKSLKERVESGGCCHYGSTIPEEEMDYLSSLSSHSTFRDAPGPVDHNENVMMAEEVYALATGQYDAFLLLEEARARIQELEEQLATRPPAGPPCECGRPQVPEVEGIWIAGRWYRDRAHHKEAARLSHNQSQAAYKKKKQLKKRVEKLMKNRKILDKLPKRPPRRDPGDKPGLAN